MTKLSRIPRLLLLPALCLAACTADEPATLNADGQALVIEDLRIAGSGTRAAQPIEGSFVEGSRLQAKITYNGQTSTGLYTYNNNVWTSNDPAYWLSATQTQTVTLRTPTPDPAMPDEFTATNWHQYDLLIGQVTDATPGTALSATLSHTRAQLCVTLTAGTGLQSGDLTNATVAIANSSTLWHHDNGAHYALLDPDTYATLPALTITLGNETYTYTPGTDAPALAAGKCLMLTLSVSKAQVSALSTTSTGWQELTATGTEVADVTILHCATPGTLSTTNNLDNLSGRVYVTGTIDNTDLSALTGKLKNVTHLYIAAESGETGEGGLTVPAEFASSNNSLQAVAILHATSIGNNAFRDCIGLESIELPAAKTIGDNAFNMCIGLRSIDLPKATSIGSEAFYMCKSLTSIDLPIATSIRERALGGCSSLTSIDLPIATSIGSNAFEGCSSLTSIDLPIATRIGSYAFFFCEKLKNINLPAANDIGSDAFRFCTGLESLAVPSTATAGSNIFYRSSPTTLFLTDEDTDEDTAAGLATWGGVTWQTIYYGYQGSGDYLDPGSYEGEWTINN